MQDNQRSEAVLKDNLDGPDLKTEKQKEMVGVPLFNMFRFADNFDYLMMTIGTIGALGLGASTPLFILFWGDFTNVFGESKDQIVDMALEVLKKFFYLAIGAFFSGWMMISCWLISG